MRRVSLTVVAVMFAAVAGGASVAHAATTTAAAANYGYDDPAKLVQGEYSAAIRVPHWFRPRRAASRGRPSVIPSYAAAGVAAEDEYVNLATEARTTHILQGDATGGGHLWPARLDSVPGGLVRLSRHARDLDIRVIIDNTTGEIVTGYPTNLPRNP